MTYTRLLPKIMQSDFLNQDEINDIKNKVFDLKSSWEARALDTPDVQPQRPFIMKTRMLSNGMYSRDYASYVKGVEKIKPIMSKSFQIYYDKIRFWLEEYYKKPVSFLDGTNYPGFHIFSLSEEQKLGRVTKFNFHKDKFGYLNKFIIPGDIVSIIIPITIPKIGGSLLYTAESTLPSPVEIATGKYTRFEYQVGMMAAWGGDVFHSIEPMYLVQGECRITLQMHLNITDNGIPIFW